MRRTRKTPVPRVGRRMGTFGVGRGPGSANDVLRANRGVGVEGDFVVRFLP